MRRTKLRGIGLAVAAGLIAAVAPTGAAQTPATSPSSQKKGPLVFGSGVTVVAVPVFVTDKAGRSVGGLTVDDFEIEDNGNKVPIVAFQAIDVDAPAPPEEIAQLPIAVKAAARRQFVVLVDMGFTTLRGLAQSRKSAAAFIRDTLAPGDLVAAAVSTKKGLNLLTNFTADHEFAARAIESGRTVSDTAIDPLGLGTPSPASANDTLNEAIAELEAQERTFLEDVRTREAEAFLNNAVSLVKLLASLRGRKQLVLMSSSFPESVWITATHQCEATRITCPDENNRLMHELFREATTADVVVHTIDLNGIEGPMDLQQQSAASASADIRSSGGARSGTGTLVAMAHNTGGTYIRPRNDFKLALDQMDQVSRRSYVVAFETSNPEKSDRPRKVKVRVRREGLSVSHRATYSLNDTRTRTDAKEIRMQAAESIAKGLSDGPLRVGLSTLPYRDAAGKGAVHAVVQIDGPALADAARGSQLAVQVYGYAMDHGRVLDSIALNTSMDLTKIGEDVRRSGLRIVTAFPVATPSMDVRFFVRAGTEGAYGSAGASVASPSFADGTRFVSPPLFTLSRAGNVAIPFQPAGRPRIDIPFRLGTEAFIPETSAVLRPGQSRDACVFVWPQTPAGSALEVSGEIVRDGETAKPVRTTNTPRVVVDPDGFDRYVISIVVPDTEPGDYRLRLKFAEPGTNRSSLSESTIRIER